MAIIAMTSEGLHSVPDHYAEKAADSVNYHIVKSAGARRDECLMELVCRREQKRGDDCAESPATAQMRERFANVEKQCARPAGVKDKAHCAVAEEVAALAQFPVDDAPGLPIHREDMRGEPVIQEMARAVGGPCIARFIGDNEKIDERRPPHVGPLQRRVRAEAMLRGELIQRDNSALRE